ncbi:MAG TPA: hypothetical protein VNA44_05970 [Burkholderiaceae bacterium]|nr:hypothetical protein [Burkholderiaceae bacterium]
MRSLKLIDRALVTMAVIVIAMTLTTAGLTAANGYLRPQHAGSIDAGSQGGIAAEAALPGAINDDPELMRTDRANVHHG